MTTATASTSVLLAARAVNATKTYGRDHATVVALDSVSIDIAAGHFLAIMGPSGSGKSTLLHCLAGLDRLDSGQIFIGDADLGGLSDRDLTRLRRDRIGFVFQSFNLLPTLSASDNIRLPLLLAGRTVDPDWLRTIVDLVDLSDRLSHRPSELSGGQQQRVAIARALASQPAIVFADEPTGNLDSRSGADILRFLRQACDEFDQTIVMVTHDPVAAAYADAVVFLADGRIVHALERPTTEQVLDQMLHMGG